MRCWVFSVSTELQDAATIVLLRDGAQGLEVLMGRRSKATRFSAGAYVFPGGAVDAQDALNTSCCAGLAAAQVDRRFAESGALRYYVAAARELFEEAGIWLFSSRRPDDWRTLQVDLHQGRVALADLLAAQDEPFPADTLHYFRFWTTPPAMPRRYRTRFFVTLAPAGQVPQADGTEFTDIYWTRPADMLARHAVGEVELIFPTIKELQGLCAYADAASALQSLPDQPVIREIRTRHQIVDGRSIRVLMPGDPGYEDLPAW